MTVTILHIDDEPISSGPAQELHTLGYRVIECDEREEAIRLLESGGVGLVICELRLRRFDGLEILQELRTTDPKLPILVVTVADRSPKLYAETLEIGVVDYLTKPVLDSQLIRTIRELLGDESGAEEKGAKDFPPEPGWPESGDLGEVPVPELLRRYHFSGDTGVCIVSSDRKRLGIQVRNGSVIGIGIREGEENLEGYLLRTGKITRDQHESVLDQIAREIGSTNEILTGMGLLDSAALVRAECDRGEERVAETFAWDTGRYQFLRDKKLKSGSTIEVQLGISELLLRAALSEPDADRAIRTFEKRAQLYVSCTASPNVTLTALLGPSEREVLEDLCGDRTISEIVETGQSDERTLYALWMAGIIELHTDPILVLEEIVASPTGSAVEVFDTTSRVGSTEAPLEALTARLQQLHDGLHNQNDFAVLSVDESSSDEEIRSAHERLRGTLPTPSDVARYPELVSRLEKIEIRVEVAFVHLANADARRAYAESCREEELEREAKAAGERALEAEEWFRTGLEAMKRERYDTAVEAFGMATHHRPDEGDYLAHLGYAMFSASPTEKLVMREAMEQIAKGIKLSPDREMPYLFLARVFNQSGDPVSSRKVYRQAIRINPECDEAMQQLRLIEQQLKKKEEEAKPKGIMGLLRSRRRA